MYNFYNIFLDLHLHRSIKYCMTEFYTKLTLRQSLLRNVALVLCQFFLVLAGANAQTLFWSDTFEDSGAPSVGVRTPSITTVNGGPPFASYFIRTDGTNIVLQPPLNGESTTYLNKQGTKFWAGENLDAALTNTNAEITKEQNITWAAINISGKATLSFKGLFAAYNQGNFPGGSSWQNIDFGPTYDFIIVEYRIDGGNWTRAGAFLADKPTQDALAGYLKEDSNNDNYGDGTLLSRSFQEFTWNITGTGSLMDLRVRVSADATATQEFAFDYFRLFNSSTLPVRLVAFQTAYLEDNVLLKWQIAEAVNVSHFEIESSNDARHFIKAGSVNYDPMLLRYQFNDLRPFQGVNKLYYRLKLIDNDASFAYSKIQDVFNARAAEPAYVYPNPVANRIEISLPEQALSKVDIFIYDESGKLMHQTNSSVTNNKLMLDLDERFNPGAYVVHVHAGMRKYTFKIVKQ